MCVYAGACACVRACVRSYERVRECAYYIYMYESTYRGACKHHEKMFNEAIVDYDCALASIADKSVILRVCVCVCACTHTHTHTHTNYIYIYIYIYVEDLS